MTHHFFRVVVGVLTPKLAGEKGLLSSVFAGKEDRAGCLDCSGGRKRHPSEGEPHLILGPAPRGVLFPALTEGE